MVTFRRDGYIQKGLASWVSAVSEKSEDLMQMKVSSAKHGVDQPHSSAMSDKQIHVAGSEVVSDSGDQDFVPVTEVAGKGLDSAVRDITGSDSREIMGPDSVPGQGSDPIFSVAVSALAPEGLGSEVAGSVSVQENQGVSDLVSDAALVTASGKTVTEVMKPVSVAEKSSAVAGGVDTVCKSYLSAVYQKPSLTTHVLTSCLEGEDQVFLVPDEIINDSTPLWEDLLLGTFPETARHIAKIHVIVNKIWTYGNKSTKIDAFVVNSTTVKFRIRDRVIRERVLRRGMWNIADMPMIISNYGPVTEEEQPALQKIPMWIELKQIPSSYFSWKGINFLSSVIGDPKRLHPETELCKQFDEAKVFVEVDLTKPLKKSFRFKTKQGVVSEVAYSYPWLPPRCTNCSKWGHLKEVCRQKIRLETEVSILKRGGRSDEMPSKEVPIPQMSAQNTPAIAGTSINQHNKDSSHPVWKDTDAGGRYVSPLGVPMEREEVNVTSNNQTTMEKRSDGTSLDTKSLESNKSRHGTKEEGDFVEF